MQRNDWIERLYEELRSDMSGTFGVAAETLSAMRNDSGMLSQLEQFPFSKQAVCTETLNLCAPVMRQLSEEPEEGWLTAVQAYLSYRLFPAEEHPQETRPQLMAYHLYLTVLNAVLEQEKAGRAFDPLFDIQLLPPEAYQKSRIAAEYAEFLKKVKEEGYILLLHITRECKDFDPLAHIAGVHHVAVHIARQMQLCGIPADLALVSGAALSHDIGKFGCRHDDAKRLPYLHYFFTDQWLRRMNLPHIAHIAANHSTWDLEYENLPAESLILIYADFRVRGVKVNGVEHMRIDSLQQAGEAILSKLFNVDAVKHRRYRLVYQKLSDFESYLVSKGVNPDPLSEALLPVRHEDAALLSNGEAVEAFQRMAIAYNLLLMESMSAQESFERLLERARSEKNLGSIRTYLNLFEEYFAYMTRSHKLQTLSFLYELLMHHERDVRRQAGQLMGRILANSGLQYRKELPEHAPETAIAPTLSEMLDECVDLWKSFLKLLIEPDQKIERKHSLRIQNSLKVVIGSLLTDCKKTDVRLYLCPFLDWVRNPPADRFALCDSITHIPAAYYTRDELMLLSQFINPLLHAGNSREQICALRALEYLAENRLEDAADIERNIFQTVQYADSTAEYLGTQLRQALKMDRPEQPNVRISELYLDNLKTTVHWIVKTANIDRLAAVARKNPSEAYHVATHFGNLLLISEHLPVREHAGQALVLIADLLTVEEINEVVIDLCLGLESGQAEYSRYVSPCLAELISRLPIGQTDETVSLLESYVCSDNVQAACAALAAFGALLVRLEMNEEEVKPDSSRLRVHIVGVMMAGLAHFEPEVHRTALMIFCRDVFGEQRIRLARRCSLFKKVCKKLLTVVSEQRGSEITFFNTAAMLNHLYRMIIECEVDIGPFAFPFPKAVAFFPGTFDPFSNGHKQIVTEILNRGFEVYLAIDEFSWSKRTQPKLLRRQIALMSVADSADVFLFPDDIPINIANPDDLSRLKSLFPGNEIYLVAGSDVIENASAYADPDLPGGAGYFNHILFKRSSGETPSNKKTAVDRLRGRVIELTLPEYFESVSSSRIREYIDRSLEITSMVNPIAEAFIRQRGLYLRTPQYKRLLRPEEQTYTVLKSADDAAVMLVSALPKAFARRMLDVLRKGNGLAALMINEGGAAASAGIFGCSVSVADMLTVLGSVKRAEFVRKIVSGKILVVEEIFCEESGAVSELVNELLTASLGNDHTYAVYCRKPGDEMLTAALKGCGFVPAGSDDVLLVDMRAPVAVTLDVFMMLKEPYASDPEIVSCIQRTRKRLLTALCETFPGELVLSFELTRINNTLIRKVQAYNGVLGLPEKPRRLGPYMCVPYGKILSDVIAPNTVTKTLHVEKVFAPDSRHFTIEEAQDYSPIKNQLSAIHSFNRPILLVDDLLHNGYRLEKLDPLFKEEKLEIKKILVGILSGRGKDLMDIQGRSVDTVYWIPNLKYWFTESLLLPFIGGDSVRREEENGASTLPSINLILPYKSPNYLREVSAKRKRMLSMTALTNAYAIMQTIEKRHKALFRRSLTLSRLGEALLLPRLPDRGSVIKYDGSVPASAYIRDDIVWMRRLSEDNE